MFGLQLNKQCWTSSICLAFSRLSLGTDRATREKALQMPLMTSQSQLLTDTKERHYKSQLGSHQATTASASSAWVYITNVHLPQREEKKRQETEKKKKREREKMRGKGESEKPCNFWFSENPNVEPRTTSQNHKVLAVQHVLETTVSCGQVSDPFTGQMGLAWNLQITPSAHS